MLKVKGVKGGKFKVEGEKIIDIFQQTVKKFGNGAHLLCLDKYRNHKAYIVILDEVAE